MHRTSHPRKSSKTPRESSDRASQSSPSWGTRAGVRLGCLTGAVGLLLYWAAALSQTVAAPGQAVAAPTAPRDGQHDFDFEIGTWKTHLSRLVHPLSGSQTWVELNGTSVVRKIWNGRANLVELQVDGPAGHLEGLSVRLYNPESHQWSIYYSNSRQGTMGVPTTGEFTNGRGEFYDQEPLNGRMILVRNVFSDITPDSCRFEQAFSADGGKTWEVNWIAVDTRVPESGTGR